MSNVCWVESLDLDDTGPFVGDACSTPSGRGSCLLADIDDGIGTRGITLMHVEGGFPWQGKKLLSIK